MLLSSFLAERLEVFEARGEWLDLSCPTCKTDYHGPAARRLAEVALARLEAQSPESVDVAEALENLSCVMTNMGTPAGHPCEPQTDVE